MNNFRSLFPIFTQEKNLVYLDSSATSLKPQTVIQALTDYYQKYSVNSHSENSNPLFQQVEKTIQETRKLVAQNIQAQPEEIIFVPSATYALNILALSLRGYLTQGDKIALTYLEHSSNLYPWQAMVRKKEIKLTFLPLDENFIIDIKQLPNYIDQQTRIVSFFHMSNSLGVINPVAEITRKIKEINPQCLVILDACQSIRQAPIEVTKWNIDALIFSGHKIYGPTGIGVLWLKKKLGIELPHLLWGGGKKTYPEEKIAKQDLFLPQKFEVGTLPLAQIFGLQASLKFINKLNPTEINQYETKLRNYTLQQLKKIPNLIIYNQNQFPTNIITFNLSSYHAHDIADYLGKNNIFLRAGDFCCPYLAKVIGVNSALRISLDIHNNQSDIERLVNCLQEIIRNPQLLIPFN